MKLALLIVAVVLFLLSAITAAPAAPYTSTLRGLGLAAFAGAFAAP